MCLKCIPFSQLVAAAWLRTRCTPAYFLRCHVFFEYSKPKNTSQLSKDWRYTRLNLAALSLIDIPIIVDRSCTIFGRICEQIFELTYKKRNNLEDKNPNDSISGRVKNVYTCKFQLNNDDKKPGNLLLIRL